MKVGGESGEVGKRKKLEENVTVGEEKTSKREEEKERKRKEKGKGKRKKRRKILGGKLEEVVRR